jgi:hypothetical protein
MHESRKPEGLGVGCVKERRKGTRLRLPTHARWPIEHMSTSGIQVECSQQTLLSAVECCRG